jgi:hypothetical protein
MPLVQVGATDISRYYILRDSTTHLPKTDVDVTTIDIYSIGYRAAIATKIDCTALASADASHTDGGAYHCGQGIYRIDWPDLWSGNPGTVVQLVIVAAGVDTTFEEIELSPSVNVSHWGGTVPITATDLKKLKARSFGRFVRSGNEVTFYDSDGTTVLLTFTLSATERTVT